MGGKEDRHAERIAESRLETLRVERREAVSRSRVYFLME